MQVWCNVCCGSALSFATVADVGCATLVGQKRAGIPDAEVGKVCVDAYACFRVHSRVLDRFVVSVHTQSVHSAAC